MSSESMRNGELTIRSDIEQRIFTFRGVQVMIDRDLAELYGVEPKRLNEQVKRNMERFPETFRFQLSKEEKDELVANCDRLQSLKHSATLPFAFTEQGVSMLSAVLRSETAVRTSIQIINSFVKMRQFLSVNADMFKRLDILEKRQITHEIKTDERFEKVFDALEDKNITPAQGIFFEGQIFDAYVFVNDLFRSAKTSIVLIDNYVDDTVLMQLAKRPENVSAVVLTKTVTARLKQDLKKHNAQYPPIRAKAFPHSHDRFVIIDGEEVYHIGASLKDLGKKWFAFSRMEMASLAVMERVEEVLG